MREPNGREIISKTDADQRYELRHAIEPDFGQHVPLVGQMDGGGKFLPSSYPPDLLMGLTRLQALGVGNNHFLPEHDLVTVRGRNWDIDTSSLPEDIWGSSLLGGGEYPFPAASLQLNAVSTDVNDSISGTGGRIMIIDGLDIDFMPIQEIVLLNGTTPVLTAQSFFRVNSLLMFSAGVTNRNLGHISVSQDGVGVPLCVMPPNWGRSSHGVYSVPINRSAFVASLYFAVLPGSPGAEVLMSVRFRSAANPLFGTSLSSCWIEDFFSPVASDGTSSLSFNINGMPVAPGGYDTKTQVLSSTANNVSVFTFAQLLTVEDGFAL